MQTASDWSRGVLHGVADFLAAHGPWDVFVEPRGFHEEPRLPRGWSGDGLLVRLVSPALAGTIRRAGVPAVNVSWLGGHTPAIPQVVSDEQACGRLAAEHFLERGFESFAFVGPPERLGYGPALAGAFDRHVRGAGHRCDVFAPPGAARRRTLYEDRVRLERWLGALARPVGIVTWNGESAREVVSVCGRLGIRVPEDIAVLCVEHDELMSALSPVPVSSIDQNPRTVGYEAAALLARLMNGATAPPEPLRVAPVEVVQRRSSETFAVDDVIVTRALALIRERGTHPLRVLDVASAVGISRRALEQRFRRSLGRTPAAEIRRVRLDRAKRLLRETDLTLADIAERTGFTHPEILMRRFRAEVGTPPGAWRRQRRR